MFRNLILIDILLIVAEFGVGDVDKDRIKWYCDGNCSVTRERCSCQSTCKTERNCCTDYTESCIEGGKSWKDTECTPQKDMKCPDGYKDLAPVVVLSIDGYRDIYFNRNFTPTITKLAKCGVKTPYIRSAYPTKSFTNHYTIATGLYPESHGIISNTIYDHESGTKFRRDENTSFDPHWWGGEPIWVSASNQGLKSATYYWAGGEVNITRYPDYYFNYSISTPLEERAHKVFDWLDMPKEERPSIMMIYNSDVDIAGHDRGPYGKEVNESLVDADAMVEMIMNGLRDRNLDTCVNFIITSDHGMASVDCTDKFVDLENYGINVAEITFEAGAFVRLGKSLNTSWSKFDPVEMKNQLKCKSDAHWTAYLKSEYLPKRYHYANNKWIEDLHLVMDDEWWSGVKNGKKCEAGGHGYDNVYADMRGFFTAHGSSFKRAYVKDQPFDNIEVYNLMAGLLEITPAPNNGTMGSLYDILRNPPNTEKESNGIEPKICSLSAAIDAKCPSCQGISQSDVDNKLKVSDEQAQGFQSKNMPYGRPRIFREGSQYCVLAHDSYVAAYDKGLKMPLITSFVVTGKETQPKSASSCFMQDNRVDNASTFECSVTSNKEGDAGVKWTRLFPFELAEDSMSYDTIISSNLIPTYGPFAEIWSFMAGNILQWAKDYGGVTVDIGPIFDYNYDGHFDRNEVLKKKATYSSKARGSDSPVPTHYFIVSTRCKNGTGTKTIMECSKSLDEIEVFSLIIPNYKEAPCHEATKMKDWVPRALLPHVARIKDIELLTGISFFTKWMTGDATQDDIIKSIVTKLFLPETSNAWVYDFLTQPAGVVLLSASLLFTSIAAAFVTLVIS